MSWVTQLLADMADSTTLMNRSTGGFVPRTFQSLPNELRQHVWRALWQNVHIQIMERHSTPLMFGTIPIANRSSVSRLADRNQNTQELWLLATLPETLEFLTDSAKLNQLQILLTGSFDASAYSVQNFTLTTLRQASMAVGFEATAALIRMGFNLQIYGYGVPNLQAVSNNSSGWMLQNVRQITFSPTFFHGLSYSSALRALPNLRIILIDSLSIRFSEAPYLFSADGFMAGVYLNKVAAHRRLRTVAERYFPHNLATWGVTDALIVRQIFFENTNLQGSGVLSTVFAKRVSESVPASEGPWLVHCSVVPAPIATRLKVQVHSMADPNLLLNIDIRDTTRLALDLNTLPMDRLNDLQQAYSVIAPTEALGNSAGPFITDGGISLLAYFTRDMTNRWLWLPYQP